MKTMFVLSLAVGALAASASAQLVENFDDPFGEWTNRWLYRNSNMGNVYVIQGNGCDESYRGNNPQGLWIVDSQVCDDGGSVGGPIVTINIDPSLGHTLRSFGFGVEAFVQQDITIYDLNGDVVGSLIGASGGGFDFDHSTRIDVNSGNGIGKIVFDSNAYGGGQIEGNTSVDNFVAEVVEIECYADFTGDGVLDLFDFLAFVNSFNAGDDAANCDGEGGLDLFDFLCFTNSFNEGC